MFETKIEIQDGKVVEIIELIATDLDAGTLHVVKREVKPTNLSVEDYKAKLVTRKEAIETKLATVEVVVAEEAKKEVDTK